MGISSVWNSHERCSNPANVYLFIPDNVRGVSLDKMKRQA